MFSVSIICCLCVTFYYFRAGNLSPDTQLVYVNSERICSLFFCAYFSGQNKLNERQKYVLFSIKKINEFHNSD